MREQADREHQEELNVYVKTTQDLKTQMEAMHVELTAKQVCLPHILLSVGSMT